MSASDAEGAGCSAPAVPRGPIAWFAANPVATNLLTVFLLVAGAIAGSQLVVQNFPEFDSRRITIAIPSPGAFPREVEEDINRRVEEAIIGISGVSRVVGKARDGVGRIEVELETFADEDAVLNDVENAIDSIENFPPPNVGKPEIVLQRWANDVLTLSLSSASVTENDLRLAAERLRDRLLGLPAVSHVQLAGTRNREITIELSEEELRRHRLKCPT